MDIDSHPTCWIIAGPNSTGETTFALSYLPMIADCKRFMNADLIAVGLNPLAPEVAVRAASRVFLAEIENCIQARENFAFETTLSGRGYLRLIKRLKIQGWRVELIYLALPSAEMSLMRVRERVAHGGHNIPEEAIYRRFPRSLRNLLIEYSVIVDSTLCFMNTGDTPKLVFEQEGKERRIVDNSVYEQLQEGMASK